MEFVLNIGLLLIIIILGTVTTSKARNEKYLKNKVSIFEGYILQLIEDQEDLKKENAELNRKLEVYGKEKSKKDKEVETGNGSDNT